MRYQPMAVSDAAWLLLESRDTPMHVSGLFEFSLPDGADGSFLSDLFRRFSEERDAKPPWNQRLARAPVVGTMPILVEQADVDIDYHFRHSALPAPGGERELGVLVSRLHSHQLDLRRPLWEAHLIEGLHDDRFALLVKMHHALVDGTSAIRQLLRTFSSDPDDGRAVPFWSVGAGRRGAAADRGDGFDPLAIVRRTADVVGTAAQVATSLARAATDLGRSTVEGGALRAPYNIPRSALQATLTGNRRLATQQLELERLKRLAKLAGCTLNDLVLYLSGTTLRRYLDEHGTLPDRTMTAGIPVNLRAADDQSMGTSIGLICADLGTTIADPLERLVAVRRSADAAKQQQRSMPKAAVVPFGLGATMPYVVGLVAGLGGRAPTPYNVAISNAPGPTEPLYMAGARLDALFPVSLLTHGIALNITCVSYAGTLNFGFVGARDVVPHLQHLAGYLADAVDELAELLGA